MQSFAAQLMPSRVRRSAPLHAFALRDGSAQIYARAAGLDPRAWVETFAGQARDRASYELLERTMDRGFLYRYLVLSLPNEKPMALQPLILVDQDLSLSLGEKPGACWDSGGAFFRGCSARAC